MMIVEKCYQGLGAKILMLRGRNGWTQEEAAKRLGLSRGSLANIETGRQRILIHKAIKYAATFGVSPKQFFKGIL